MGRNDIRLRRNKISSRRIDRYRNYGELMSRHEQNQKIKRLTKIFIYFWDIFLVDTLMHLNNNFKVSHGVQSIENQAFNIHVMLALYHKRRP